MLTISYTRSESLTTSDVEAMQGPSELLHDGRKQMFLHKRA